jgi:flavin-binding protein dodecin
MERKANRTQAYPENGHGRRRAMEEDPQEPQDERGVGDHAGIVKVIEVLAESPHSWEDAAYRALEQAQRSVHGITSIYVKDMQAVVESGRIRAFRLNAKISFAVEERFRARRRGGYESYETTGRYREYGHVEPHRGVSYRQGHEPPWGGTQERGGYYGLRPRMREPERYFAQPQREQTLAPWRQAERPFRGPKGYKRSDERIREDVCDRLAHADELDPSEIEVSVSNGEVTLIGSVPFRGMKYAVEQHVEEVRGVSDVNNQLRVRRDDDVQRPRGSTSGRRGGMVS